MAEITLDGKSAETFKNIMKHAQDFLHELSDEAKVGFFDGFFALMQREENFKEYREGYVIGQSAFKYYSLRDDPFEKAKTKYFVELNSYKMRLIRTSQHEKSTLI